jgi:hypothetical protein
VHLEQAQEQQAGNYRNGKHPHRRRAKMHPRPDSNA